MLNSLYSTEFFLGLDNMIKNKYSELYSLSENTWDEMFNQHKQVREEYKKVMEYLNMESSDELNKKEELPKVLLMS